MACSVACGIVVCDVHGRFVRGTDGLYESFVRKQS